MSNKTKRFTDEEIKLYAVRLNETSNSLFVAISDCESLLGDKVTEEIRKEGMEYETNNLLKRVVKEYLEICDTKHLQKVQEYGSYFQEFDWFGSIFNEEADLQDPDKVYDSEGNLA